MDSKITFKKFIGHLTTVLKHKHWVFYYSCKLGIPFRGFIHDLSKFNPIEFLESARYYVGTESPIVECKRHNGYSLAWQHHKGHNPHHYEYWIDKIDDGGVPLIIPFIYCVEMICDWLAAGKVYSMNAGKEFTYQSELAWWNTKKNSVQHSMHKYMIEFFDLVFNYMAETNTIPSKSRLNDMYVICKLTEGDKKEIDILMKKIYNK